MAQSVFKVSKNQAGSPVKRLLPKSRAKSSYILHIHYLATGKIEDIWLISMVIEQPVTQDSFVNHLTGTETSKKPSELENKNN